MKIYYTDYPIAALGDPPGKEAPVRKVMIYDYDGDKYCNVLVDGCYETIKSGYIYTERGRLGEVPVITKEELASFTKQSTSS